MTDNGTTAILDADAERQRRRLVELRSALLAERANAISPAVAGALGLADTYLFLALGYVGHTDELFPGEAAP